MGLKFVFGRSGVGKTKYLREYVIAEAIRHPESEYCVIVPEQFNLQTQKAYVSAHPAGGILNIDILSFKRLAYRIFSEVGGFNNKILNDSGKLMILKKIVSDNSQSLTLLQRPLKRLDSVAKLKSILSEFEQYHVSRETLSAVISENKIPGLSSKLEDLSLLQEAFSSYIEQKYVTDEQLMDILAKRLEHSEFVKNTVFIFDDFTGFTYLQNEVIRKLIRYSKNVIVALTLDSSYVNKTVVPVHDLFALSVSTKTELIQIAQEEGITVLPHLIIESEKRDDEFDYIERHLFDYVHEVYNKKTDKIVICKAESPEEEVLYLRNIITKLVRNKSYSYKDIAVVTGDMSRYGLYFEKYMKEAQIPCFVDDSKELRNNSMLEAVRALIKICIEDFSYQSVFAFLRNNLNSFTPEETDIIENYVISCGIRSFGTWSHEWEKTIGIQNNEQLMEINRLRESFILDVKEFVHVMKDRSSTVKSKVFSLYSFLADTNMEGKLHAMSEYFESIDDRVRAVEYKQVYGLVLNLLDNMVELMGNEIISAEEFLEILDAGFSTVKIGVLPPGTDYVLLGDVERTRFSKTKVLFLLGANEGVIPKKNDNSGFINESERLILKESGVRLTPTSHEEYFTQRYYLYRMFSKATEKLYVCYSESSKEGDDYAPSYIVKELRSVFPKCVETVFEKEFTPETLPDAYNYILSEENQNERKNVYYSYLLNKEEYRNRLDMYEKGCMYKGDEDTISEKLAGRLFKNCDDEFVTSVSRLEAYAKCPFYHFLRYGLNINKRTSSDINYIDFGNIFHNALEEYVLIISKMNMDITDMQDTTAFALAEECIRSAYIKIYRASYEPSAREKYHVKRMSRLMCRTVWAMKRQFEQTDFKIDAVEVKFSPTNTVQSLPINDHEKAYLVGKIDRIDTYSDGAKEYVRIVDYKTGSESFSMLKFYHGLQLQLVIYLDVATGLISRKHNNEVVPAGAFYYHIEDPVIEADIKDKADVDNEILSKLRLNGYQNVSIPEFADKKIDEESMQLMIKHGRHKVSEISNEILSGNISMAPYRLYDGGDSEACTMCDYKSVCGFDNTFPWCRYRVLDTVKASDIITRIKESEGAEDELD